MTFVRAPLVDTLVQKEKGRSKRAPFLSVQRKNRIMYTDPEIELPSACLRTS